MKIKCPKCGNKFIVDDKNISVEGTIVECPGCHKKLKVRKKIKKENSETDFDKTIPAFETDSSGANNLFDDNSNDQLNLPTGNSSIFDDEPAVNSGNLDDIFGDTQGNNPAPDLDLGNTNNSDLFSDDNLPSDNDLGAGLSDESDDIFSSNSSLPDIDDELPPLPTTNNEDLFSDNSNLSDLPDESNTEDIFGENINDNLSDNFSTDDSDPFSTKEQEEDNKDSFPDFNWEDEKEKPDEPPKPTEKSSQIFNDIADDELKIQIDESEAEEILQNVISRDSGSKKEKKPVSIISIIIFTIIFSIIGLGTAYYFFPEQLPIKKIYESLINEKNEKAIKNLYKNLDSSQKIETAGIKRFINDNKQNIVLFYGSDQNISSETRSYFKIKIILFDKDEKPIFEKKVYAGNSFKEKELVILPPNEIEKKLRNKFGDTFINESIEPGKAIPFNIVIVNPPAFVDYRIVSESSMSAN